MVHREDGKVFGLIRPAPGSCTGKDMLEDEVAVELIE
jgi:hypothetical protein